MSQKKVLVTGGCGYIGSHTCIELLETGYEVVVVDDLSNGYEENLDRVKAITGKNVTFYKIDIKNTEHLREILSQNIDTVIHFAGLKSPTESISEPMRYFDVNVSGTVSLLKAMEATNVQQLIFSSTAAVYGIPELVPVTEKDPVGNTLNPYAESKLIIENLLKSYGKTREQFQFVILRYFNPVGAHSSGVLGEKPKGMPNNLMPHVGLVATGLEPMLKVFGDDYSTPDGTGIRDYIHVMDLARGHVSAINYLDSGHEHGLFNLGTGIGYSVLDLVKCFETVTGQSIPLDFAPRRKGDVASCFANVDLAKEMLNWEAKQDLSAMCSDTWRWLKNSLKE